MGSLLPIWESSHERFAMKLNWAERWVVNNPSRVLQQGMELRWLHRRMSLKPGALVLEVGCGRGAGADLILKKFQLETIHAMDLDLEMIRKAGKYLPSNQRKRVFMNTADVMHLPYRSEFFDAVFGFGVLHHVPDWRRGLAEIARVLKTGGVYIMEELYPTLYQNFITRHILLHPEQDRFSSSDLKTALETQHLSIEAILEVKVVGILAVVVKTG
jgi:ubiquinone/menaquinone biosynthesis C-methylase UbiE